MSSSLLERKIAELEAALDRDLAAMLKGGPITTPPPYICRASDMVAVEYWRIRAEMAQFAAARSLKIAESYRQRSVATQRAADNASEQASSRERKLNDRIKELETKIENDG